MYHISSEYIARYLDLSENRTLKLLPKKQISFRTKTKCFSLECLHALVQSRCCEHAVGFVEVHSIWRSVPARSVEVEVYCRSALSVPARVPCPLSA